MQQQQKALFVGRERGCAACYWSTTIHVLISTVNLSTRYQLSLFRFVCLVLFNVLWTQGATVNTTQYTYRVLTAATTLSQKRLYNGIQWTAQSISQKATTHYTCIQLYVTIAAALSVQIIAVSITSTVDFNITHPYYIYIHYCAVHHRYSTSDVIYSKLAVTGYSLHSIDYCRPSSSSR
jgi:hypothetical protein